MTIDLASLEFEKLQARIVEVRKRIWDLKKTEESLKADEKHALAVAAKVMKDEMKARLRHLKRQSIELKHAVKS